MRFRFSLAWAALVVSLLFFIHGVLGFPWFSVSYGFFFGSCLILAVILWHPSFELASLAFFGIPWSMGFLLISVLGAPGRKEIGLFFIVLLGLCYGLYHRLALVKALAKVHDALDPLAQGQSCSGLQIPFEDEIGRFLGRLDQLSFRFREVHGGGFGGHGEGWSDLRIAEHQPHAEKWMISLLCQWQVGVGASAVGVLERTLLAVDTVCTQGGAFLNSLDSCGCELVFSLEIDGAESQAVLALAELRRELVSIQGLGAALVLRRTFVKGGVLRRSVGDRFSFAATSFRQDKDYLVEILDPGQIRTLIHDSLDKSGPRVFHLGDRSGDYFEILREKEMESHLENLASTRVEDKLVSIRVITAHQCEGGSALLRPLLEDVSPRVRMEAVKAMASQVHTQDKQGIAKDFSKALKQEWNHDIRATLVAALGKVGDKAGVQELLGLLDDENDRVRANAIEAVGSTLGRSTILRKLRDKLEDPNNRARANAALAVWLMGSKEGLEHLVSMAKASDSLTSCSGLYGIGEVFRIDNLRILFPHLSNPLSFYLQEGSLFESSLEVCQKKIFNEHPLVEKNAIIALGKMGSRTSIRVLEHKYFQTENKALQQWIIEALLEMGEFTLVSWLREAKDSHKTQDAEEEDRV
jgi:hypothetical protein